MNGSDRNQATSANERGSRASPCPFFSAKTVEGTDTKDHEGRKEVPHERQGGKKLSEEGRTKQVPRR